MKETAFDQWARRHAVDFPLAQLNGGMGEGRAVRIGIEAEHFLMKFAGKEPLNGALGGDPLSLEDKVMVELSELKKLNCQVIFFFHGCTYGPYIEPFSAATAAAENNNRAFAKYEEAAPKEAIEIFRANDFSERFPVLEWLKTVLGKFTIPFIVAPFSAHAQMIEALNQGSIDAYYASTEIFLFGAGQIIWNVDVKIESSKTINDNGETTYTSVPNIADSVFKVLDWESISAPGQFSQGPVSDILLKDAMILTGSSPLPAFPALIEMPFPAVVDRLVGFQGQVENMIQGLTSVDRKSREEYCENFVKISASITHMVILNHINETAPRTGSLAPSDLQQALAARLPDELSFYMSTGLISPKVLNWCLTHKIAVKAPFDGGDELYKQIIRDTLNPVREQTYAVLASLTPRYFTHTSNSTEYWFGAPKQEFKASELPLSQHSLTTWRVRDKLIAEAAKALDTPNIGLLFSLASLGDAKFPPKTISKKDTTYENWDADPLTTESEIVNNTTWRMLMLRGYVAKNHELTPWGKVALAALKAAGPSKDLGEAVFVAIELLRAGHLSPKVLLADQQAESLDRRNTQVIAKVLTTGQMSHLSKGYSGPLSRKLLSFHASVSAMRTSLRDLTEATAANLFLGGDGERNRESYFPLVKELPFQGRFSCGLGILMSTYLDEYHTRAVDEASLSDINAWLANRMQQYCAHTLIKPSLEHAVSLWDAVMSAVRASGDLVNKEDKAAFEEVDKWFAGRRPGTKHPVVTNVE